MSIPIPRFYALINPLMNPYFLGKWLINYRIFGRNFRTTNTRRPVKGSKVADCRLVFSKKETKNCLLGLGARTRWCHPKKLNLPQLCRPPKKSSNPKPSSFLIDATRLSASVEGLNSSQAQSADELWPNKQTCPNWANPGIWKGHFTTWSQNTLSFIPTTGLLDDDERMQL